MPLPDPPDPFGRPLCQGWGPSRRCRTPVHPGYTRCYRCDRPYTAAMIQAALAHPQNASFRGLHKVATPAPESPRLRALRHTDPPGTVVYATSDRVQFPAELLCRWDRWAWVYYRSEGNAPVTVEAAGLFVLEPDTTTTAPT